MLGDVAPAATLAERVKPPPSSRFLHDLRWGFVVAKVERSIVGSEVVPAPHWHSQWHKTKMVPVPNGDVVDGPSPPP